MEEAEDEPSEEDDFPEEFVLLADEVHLGIVRVEHLLLVDALAELVEGRFAGTHSHIHLGDGSQDDWHGREDHVVEGDRPT